MLRFAAASRVGQAPTLRLRPDGRPSRASYACAGPPLAPLVGQQASLDDRLTGRENLRLLGRLQKLAKANAFARADELLARFGIEHAGDRQVPGNPKVGYTQLYGAPGTAGVSILSV